MSGLPEPLMSTPTNTRFSQLDRMDPVGSTSTPISWAQPRWGVAAEAITPNQPGLPYVDDRTLASPVGFMAAAKMVSNMEVTR
jgi:hypothetical protein